MAKQQPALDELLDLMRQYNELYKHDAAIKVSFYSDQSGTIYGRYNEDRLFAFDDLRECAKWLKKRIKKAKHKSELSRPALVKTLYEHWRVPEYPWQITDYAIGEMFKADRAQCEPQENWLYRYESHNKYFTPKQTGGKTVCTLVLSNGESIVGTAYCSMSDNFCYRTGRQIALERAQKQYREQHGES
jgi:hypothetical protein